MKAPTWVRDDVVLAIHQRQLAEHGGLDRIRDEGLVESALNRPKNLFASSEPKPDLSALAAAFAFGLTKNHPFADANKRTAYTVCRTFLLLNRFDLAGTQQKKYLTFLQLAEGGLSEEQLGEWIRGRTEEAVRE